MADIKDKIKKLLALAKSPNENEARDALLKARALMAKHKLTELEMEEVEKQELKHIVCTPATWTSDSGKIWMVSLCDMLCSNYCCAASWNHKKGHRTYTLVITGMGGDADLCDQVIRYAIGFMDGRIEDLLKKYHGDRKSIINSYAMGFIEGMKIAFEMQEEEHKEWGLVLVKPEEVKRYADGLGSKDVKTKNTSFNALAYMRGQADGEKFNAGKALGKTS